MIAESTDLYIAHCLAALPAAAIASQHHQARLGFDKSRTGTKQQSLKKITFGLIVE